MSHIKFVVNDEVLFDDEVGDGQWAQEPPAFVKEHLKPGTRPQQWIRAAMIVFTESIVTKRSVEIIVHHEGKNWDMKVVNG